MPWVRGSDTGSRVLSPDCTLRLAAAVVNDLRDVIDPENCCAWRVAPVDAIPLVCSDCHEGRDRRIVRDLLTGS